jgi:hypothetical protein
MQPQYFAAMKAKPFLLFLFMVGVMILVTTYVMIQNNGEISSQTGFAEGSVHNAVIVEAKNQSSIPNGAFAFLALGAQANQLNCPAAVESLVRYGGWDGEIYLITDQANCFDPKEIVQNAGMKDPKKFHYVKVKESFSKGGIDWHHSSVGFRQSRVRSFAMKTKLFELIPEQHVDVVAYVDCDILFTQQQCPKQFIQAGGDWKENMIKFGHVATDKTGFITGLHAGTFVVHRKHSEEILKLWHDQILAGLDEGDNDAFMRVYRQYDIADPTGAGKKPENYQKEYIYPKNKFTLSSLLIDPNKPASDSSNWFERFIDPIHFNSRESTPCMTHISKARCTAFGREKIQSFVSQFHLKTYDDNRYYYCTHKSLQTLLYGWFPFGYLPFCPKMEMIL